MPTPHAASRWLTPLASLAAICSLPHPVALYELSKVPHARASGALQSSTPYFTVGDDGDPYTVALTGAASIGSPTTEPAHASPMMARTNANRAMVTTHGATNAAP